MKSKILSFLRLTKENDLELRLYSIALFISTSVTIFTFLAFLLSNESYTSTNIVFLFSISALLFFCYKLYIEKSFYKYLTYAYILTMFICVDSFFFTTEGIFGGAVLTLTAVSVLSNFLLKEKKEKTFLLFFITINFFAIYTISKIFPEIILKYNSEIERELDFVISGFSAVFFSALLVKIFKDNYDKDRENLKFQKLELIQINQELEKAKIKAEELANVKSSFLSNMSHELRTPLNGIMAMSELFPSYKTESEKNKAIEIIQNSSKLLLNIVNDILDYSKIDSGNLRLESLPISLQKILEGIKESFSFEKKILNEDIQFEINLDEKIEKTLIGDSFRITQILINLISNAIKFTERGKVLINAKLLEDNIEEQRILFEVLDTGIGIRNKENLFQIFSQEDSSITRKYGGTGLGLVIAKNLVLLMNGDIFVESEFGKGSKFSFYVDLKKPEVKKVNFSMDNDSSFYAKYNSILLVEDDKSNQTIFQMFMRKLKLNFDIADNGLIALEKVRNKSYDFIFMDMNMPVMDGITATLNIRELPLPSQPKIVALTANILEEYKEKCFKSGMNDFLTKPYTIIDLKKVLSV